MERTDVPAELDILTFWVDSFLLGVEADQIAWLASLSRRELATSGKKGGAGLPVEDLRLSCGLSPASDEAQQQFLVVNRAGRKVAYMVDRVGDLITVMVFEHIKPLPPPVDMQKQWQQLWGVCEWEDQLVFLVDLEYEPCGAG
ncbi:MAG: chemotaxis protein CheW [Syntrophobacteria bacterium]